MASPDRDAYDAGLIAFKARNFVQALKIWRPLAERGRAQAQVGVGEILLYGSVGVDRLCELTTRRQSRGYGGLSHRKPSRVFRISTMLRPRARRPKKR